MVVVVVVVASTGDASRFVSNREVSINVGTSYFWLVPAAAAAAAVVALVVTVADTVDVPESPGDGTSFCFGVKMVPL